MSKITLATTQNTKSINPFSAMEKDVLNFWEKNGIFQKSVQDTCNKKLNKGNYIFYDGPPFITGLPHYATLLPSIVKDVIPRYWTMKGYRVERIWGWDCHGLPAENKVEEELNLKNKKDIKKLGVDKFINACRSYVDNCSSQWKWYINRIGRWVDMDNAYKTMDLKFMESVIWSFKKLYNKNLIYQGYRSSLHCPRCATPLSKFEVTMDTGSYKDVTKKSVVIKFKITNLPKKLQANNLKTYLLAWTTTPWTLPGNMALAVGKNIDYALTQVYKVENRKFIKSQGDGEYYILAKDRVEEIFRNQEYKIIQEFKGSELIDLNYEPIFNLNIKKIKNNKNVFKIYSADFVNTEEGTGIVHIAPNFGEDDFQLGKKNNLPIVELMDENGCYITELVELSIKNIYFEKANKVVLENLENRNLIFSSFDTTHSYPFCYRCNTALIYKTQKAWYLNIQKIRKQLLESNENINWIPEYFKNGRFKYNLESAPDWCISRNRYWATPIPVWRHSRQTGNFQFSISNFQTNSKSKNQNSKQCDNTIIFGSIEELEELSGEKITDLHKNILDKIEFKCNKCGGVMKRVPEVLDCWFESGAVPFAQFHYPFEKKQEFPNMFPADFIIEYTGQLRGWFYYMHVLSNCLFNSQAFKNVIVTGVLAGTDGRKMSKSYGNYPDPKIVLEKYGSDALRMYFISSPIMLGDDMSLSEQDIQTALRKNIILLWNVVKFYEMFANTNKNIKNRTEFSSYKENSVSLSSSILDQWILIRLEQLNKTITQNLNKYNLPLAARPITDFIDDLSTWYLRRSRNRFKNDDNQDKQLALQTTRYVLLQLSKLIAPFIPFLAEQIWQKITGYNFKNKNKSIHLESWPKVKLKAKNSTFCSRASSFHSRSCFDEVDSVENGQKSKILKDMKLVRRIVELGLAKRDEAGIKVRQPLNQLSIINYQLSIKDSQYIDLIKDELNVKKIVFKENSKNKELAVELDTELTTELIQEGIKRELMRFINAMRKNISLTIHDRVIIYWQSSNQEICDVFNKYTQNILTDTLADKIIQGINNDVDIKKEISINEIKVVLGIKRI